MTEEPQENKNEDSDCDQKDIEEDAAERTRRIRREAQLMSEAVLNKEVRDHLNPSELRDALSDGCNVTKGKDPS